MELKYPGCPQGSFGTVMSEEGTSEHLKHTRKCVWGKSMLKTLNKEVNI